jgi:acryloyl-coenzyme A reductase
MLRDVLKSIDRPRGGDVVLETAGPPTFTASLAALRPRGRLVPVGNTEPSMLELNPGPVIVKELTIVGSARATKEDMLEVIGLVEAGELRPLAARVWPLDVAAGAHRALEQRVVTGRAVLDVNLSASPGMS